MQRERGRDFAMSDALVERFLYREARLMDTHRYEEWLALWTPDARYWVPCNSDDIDPSREVSIIYDDHERLEQRVQRLKSGTVLAQDPAPRMRRIVSNIEIETVDAEHLRVGSNFLLAVAREREQQLWAGHSIHGLRRVGDELRMHYKKVLLINSDQEMPLLQFLI
jgi:3-phenylpropionate/cinnamic acid dioxygenase small subunit